MTQIEIIEIAILFFLFLMTILKLCKLIDKHKEANDKAIMELYDRITELESKINEK